MRGQPAKVSVYKESSASGQEMLGVVTAGSSCWQCERHWQPQLHLTLQRGVWDQLPEQTEAETSAVRE